MTETRGHEDTGTLGKALGGASGGYASGRRDIIELLRQRSRPYLFSNSLAPAIVNASLEAVDLIESGEELRAQLRENIRTLGSRFGLRRISASPNS